MFSRSGLALSDDGKWLAYLRFGPGRNFLSASPRFVEIVEADTGKVHSFQVGSSSRRMNAVAFGASNEEVLLAKLEPATSGRLRRLVYLVERWSRVTGKVIATITLPLASAARETSTPDTVAGWCLRRPPKAAVHPNRTGQPGHSLGPRDGETAARVRE